VGGPHSVPPLSLFVLSGLPCTWAEEVASKSAITPRSGGMRFGRVPSSSLRVAGAIHSKFLRMTFPPGTRSRIFITLLSVRHLHDPSHSTHQTLLGYWRADVAAISVAFRKNEAPVPRPVVLRQARDREGAVHDRGCAGHWLARFFFEVLVIFFGVCAEIVFEESPFGSVSLLRVLQQVSPARFERLLVLLPSLLVRARLSWLSLWASLSKGLLMGRRKE
jgi:hypothetical protein